MTGQHANAGFLRCQRCYLCAGAHVKAEPILQVKPLLKREAIFQLPVICEPMGVLPGETFKPKAGTIAESFVDVRNAWV